MWFQLKYAYASRPWANDASVWNKILKPAQDKVALSSQALKSQPSSL